jgi:hypothetical protein
MRVCDIKVVLRPTFTHPGGTKINNNGLMMGKKKTSGRGRELHKNR